MANHHELQVLGRRRFVLRAYSKVSSSYWLARHDHDPKHLESALKELCKVLTKLRDDRVFWAALINLLQDGDEQKERLEALTQAIEETLAADVKAVIDSKVIEKSDVDLDDLMADVAIGLSLLRQAQSGQAIKNLEQRIADFADRACKPSTKRRRDANDGRRWLRNMGIVFRGVLIVAGLSWAILNAIVVLHTGQLDVLPKSALTGAQAAMGGLQS